MRSEILFRESIQPSVERKIKLFLLQNQLRYQSEWQQGVAFYDEKNELLATGFLSENLCCMMAVDSTVRGQGILGKVVSELKEIARKSHVEDLFLITKIKNKKAFQRYGFIPIVEDEVIWMSDNPFLRNPLKNLKEYKFLTEEHFPTYFSQDDEEAKYYYQRLLLKINKKIEENQERKTR